MLGGAGAGACLDAGGRGGSDAGSIVGGGASRTTRADVEAQRSSFEA